MKRASSIVSSFIVLLFPFLTMSFAAEFKPYPGAKVDEKATKEARQETGVTTTTIYTSSDPFDKVHAFYKGIAREYRMPPPEGPFNLRAGGTLKEAYFIFDEHPDIMSSKNWIKIQRPYLGRMKSALTPNPKYVEDIYEDIRDVTVIIR